MIASLAMYDLPQARRWTNRLWDSIASSLKSAGIERVPRDLTRQDDQYPVWTDPDLLLAQTCGYPLTHKLSGLVRTVATPCYDAPGCNGPNYSSLILVRAGTYRDLPSLKGTRAAYNGQDSQSGYAAFRAVIAPLAGGKPYFSETLETGGHAMSVKAVMEGQADVCTVDAVTHAMLARHEPETVAGLQTIGFTPSAPGLPLITSLDTASDVLDALRRALEQAVGNQNLAETRSELLITGFQVLAEDAYDGILAMEQRCHDFGYSTLA